MEMLTKAEKNKIASKIWRANNPDKIRNKNYKDRYGITLDDYNDMLKKQNNRCHLCGSHNDDTKLYVDHCHKTGKVRGLLCHHCNTALGLLMESPDKIKGLMYYAEKHSDV